jgi:hypothetical protein
VIPPLTFPHETGFMGTPVAPAKWNTCLPGLLSTQKGKHFKEVFDIINL